MAGLPAGLGDHEFTRLHAEGAGLGDDQAVAYALRCLDSERLPVRG